MGLVVAGRGSQLWEGSRGGWLWNTAARTVIHLQVSRMNDSCPACLHACLPASLPVCLPVCLHACLPVCTCKLVDSHLSRLESKGCDGCNQAGSRTTHVSTRFFHLLPSPSLRSTRLPFSSTGTTSLSMTASRAPSRYFLQHLAQPCRMRLMGNCLAGFTGQVKSITLSMFVSCAAVRVRYPFAAWSHHHQI